MERRQKGKYLVPEMNRELKASVVIYESDALSVHEDNNTDMDLKLGDKVLTPKKDRKFGLWLIKEEEMK